MWIPNSQIIKLIDIREHLVVIIYLVNDQYDIFVRLAQHISHLIIRIQNTLLHIYDKHDDISHFNRHFRLFSHAAQHLIACLRLNTTGIHQCKIMIQPANFRINTISCYTWRIFDNCDPLSGDHIKQR